MAKYRPIAEQIRIATQATAEATKKLLVDVARREHNKVMGADPKPVTFSREVDGKLGAPLESVSPFGIVHFRYPRVDAIAEYALDRLFEFSPVDSGLYRESHTLFLNGRAVSDLRGWGPGDDIAIGNPVPYARKIEVGAMTMRVSGTDHVYERAARAVQRKYSGLADIRFTFRGIAGGRGRGANRIDRDTRQPVLLIRAIGAAQGRTTTYG